jgi:DMSO/TMAO reductase YedYZ molybdopterin-dependent catalytic subunit
MLGFVMQRIDERSLVVAAKPDLVLLDTPELNAETPAHLLDDDITPIARLFARNTGAMPAFSVADIQNWTLAIDGCVHAPQTWTLAQLRSEFEIISETAVIECAGNGRAFFPDPAGTVLWRHGAVGCVQWTGVRLRDVLEAAGLQPAAVYTGHHSPDLYLDGSGPAISRGLPIEKATAPETLLAFELNGEPLPALHGGPLRLVAPGYPGAAFHKWLTRIEVRDREHDGERMLDGHYRMPRILCAMARGSTRTSSRSSPTCR